MTKETAEKRAIKDYFNAKRIFYWRTVQGLGSQAGVPDIFALVDGKLWAIEVKAKGGVLSPAQKEFLEDIRVNGGKVIVGGVEEVMKVL